MPIIRYVCLVGSLLLGMLFLLSDGHEPLAETAPDRWTSLDSLRAMAHLGEPLQGNTGFVREQTYAELSDRNRLAVITAQEKPLIMNAQARIDAPKTIRQSAAVKPRKQRAANRQARIPTAVAENIPRGPLDNFRPPSW